MVLSAFIERDFNVLVPFGGGHPYDLVVEVGRANFLRVQCKTAWPMGGCMIFKSQKTDHGRGPQSYLGAADLFGVYFPPNKTVYLVPIRAITSTEGRLRLVPARNNQRRGVRLAADYEIDCWTLDGLRDLIGSKESSSPKIPVA
jgi:PD-(D/E)XK nuclease superfamily protein